MEEFTFRVAPWLEVLWLHNWPIMLCSVLIVGTAFRAYLEPSRPVLLFLYGLLILAAAFEYEKHALVAVGGTIDYLLAPNTNTALHRSVRWAFLDLLPLAGYLLGALLTFLSVLSTRRRHLSPGVRPRPRR